MATPTTPVELTEVQLDFLKSCLLACKELIIAVAAEDPKVNEVCAQQLDECRKIGNTFTVAQHVLLAERNDADIGDF